DWRGVRAQLGVGVDRRVAALVDALDALQDTPLPPAPVRQRVTIAALPTGDALVTAYSSYDPLVLPRDVADALPVFDGAPMALVRHRLAERGVTLPDATLRTLLDFGALAARSA